MSTISGQGNQIVNISVPPSTSTDGSLCYLDYSLTNGETVGEVQVFFSSECLSPAPGT
jgi:hypothetical protein